MSSFALKTEYLPNYTIDEWEHWEGKWELIKGVPFAMSPMPNRKHQRITAKIITQLENKLHCDDCKAYPPIDWQIDENTVLEPDVSVVCGDLEEHYLKFPPIIIFEVLSPSTALKDKNLKFQIYQSQTVKYYIIVNPNINVAEVFKINGDLYIKEGDFKLEKYGFNWDNCELDFDFSSIWE